MQVEEKESVLFRTLDEQILNGGIDAMKKLLDNDTSWWSIPLLNYTPFHTLREHKLVRFRGMIQDMLDPEMYLERYEVKTANDEVRTQDGKYRDRLVLDVGEAANHDAQTNVHGERRTLLVVSIPGQNQWSKDYEESCNPFLISEKNGNSDNSLDSDCVQKRKTHAEDYNTMDVDVAEPTNNGTVASNKRQCKNAIQSLVNTNDPKKLGEYLLTSPIPDRPSFTCVVKIYDDFDSYVLNEVVDVVGFLSLDPLFDGANAYLNACQDVELDFETHAPLPSMMPRLHAITLRKLLHVNPLIDRSLHKSPITTDLDALNMSSVQKDLRNLFTLCLFNDEIAAEYLLSHLISTVYCRTEMQSVGKFALNICNLPKNCLPLYTTKLYEIIEQLLPASHYLPLTLETMNTAAFVPKKDYEINKLVSGLLQLAPHTHLMLDETRLEQGKLEASGVMGIQHLAHLINNQQLTCDFRYYKIDYDLNIPVLIMSEGRSMLAADFVLPLHCDDESVQLVEERFKAAWHFLQPSRLTQLRCYLTKARMSSFNIADGHSDFIQNDFVEMRKSNTLSASDELHSLLVLTRLLAIARGKERFDEEIWGIAKELESKRRQRLQALPKSASRT